eukprot:6173391-Pleurochrysis_carterae.AAC.3
MVCAAPERGRCFATSPPLLARRRSSLCTRPCRRRCPPQLMRVQPGSSRRETRPAAVDYDARSSTLVPEPAAPSRAGLPAMDLAPTSTSFDAQHASCSRSR